jgi:hypothetical protein
MSTYFVYMYKQYKTNQMSRTQPKQIANAFFAKSEFIKPGVDLWSTLDEESKSSFKQFILNARPSAPRGVSAEERVKYDVGKMPANLDKVIATRWSTIPSRKNLLTPAFLATLSPAPDAPKATTLVASKPKPTHSVKGAKEAGITASSAVAVVSSARGPEDGNDDSFTPAGNKRGRGPALRSQGEPPKKHHIFQTDTDAETVNYPMKLTVGDFGQVPPESKVPEEYPLVSWEAGGGPSPSSAKVPPRGHRKGKEARWDCAA